MTRRDIITAVPVAFDTDGSLNYDGSAKIMEFIGESGNEGVLLLGTTGEFPAMSLQERADLSKLGQQILKDKMRVVAHVGAASVYESLQLVAASKDAGITELAVLTPFYLKATDDSMFDYFKTIAAAASGMEVYLYVFQRVSGNFISPELMTRLAEIPNVVGVKVSGEVLPLLDEYRAVVPADFLIYTGSDKDLARAAEHGAQGVVSGISSVLPKPFRALRAAADAGDPAELVTAQAIVDDVVQTITGDMAKMKVAYRLLGVTDATVRMPIAQPSEEEIAEIERVIKLYS